MEKVKQIGFFRRIKMAILDLEKYDVFLKEKVSVAFKYFLKLILVLVAVFSISTTINLTIQLDKLLSYVKEEFPEFEYKDGNLNVETIVDAYDKEYDAKLIVNTGAEIAQETLDNYNEVAQESTISAVLLKDKVIIRANGIVAESTYTNLFESMGITTLTKANVVNKYNESGFMLQIGVAIYIYSFMVLYLQYFLVVLENVIVVMLFGWIASIIVGARLKLSKAFSIAIYSLTLSSILNVIYSIVANFTGFEIKYFSLMYLIIGYIYMMTAILMNKVDIIESNKKLKETEDDNGKDNKFDEMEEEQKDDNSSDKVEKENQDNLINENETVKKRKRKTNKDTKNEDNKE